MEIAVTLPATHLRHTRAAQQFIEEGRQDGQAAITLRLLTRRSAPSQF